MWPEPVVAAAGDRHSPPLRTVRLSGELDLCTLPALRAQFRELIDRQAPAAVIVDMADVTFMDCSSLPPLIEAKARLGDRLELRHVPDPVVRLLEFAGLSDLLVGPGDEIGDLASV